MFTGLISSVTTIPAQEGESSDPVQLPGGDTSLIGGSIGFGYCRLNQRHPLHHVQVVHPGLGDLGCGWSCAALVTSTFIFYTAFPLKDSLISKINVFETVKITIRTSKTRFNKLPAATFVCFLELFKNILKIHKNT